MAIARPQARPVITGVHVALIVFVVVTVASLVFTVILYTGQEELNQRVQSAESSARTASDKANAAEQKYKDLAKLLTGNPELESAAIEQQVEQIRKELTAVEDLPNKANFAQFPIVTSLRQLSKYYADKSSEGAKLKSDNEQCAKDRTDMETRVQQQTAQFTEQATHLQEQFAELKKASDNNSAKWEQQAQAFETSLNELKDKNTERLNVVQAETAKLQKDLTEKQGRIDTLVQSLEKFRPSHDPISILQSADGQVLRVLPDESIVYINLGKKDRVTPGLSFAVYSPLGGVSKDGKGKATLEVINVMPDTSECKITGVEAGNVIVEGDLIANPVYDRERKFNFVVAGDFDLNFDGIVDDIGGENVKKLIAGWGGRIVDSVDEQTDFVVLGQSPVPVQAQGGTPEAQEAARIKAEEQKAKIQSFDAIKKEARALNLPVLTRAQFLDFIGYRVPASARSEDAL